MSDLSARLRALDLTPSPHSRREIEKNLALLAAMAALVDAAQPQDEPPEFRL